MDADHLPARLTWQCRPFPDANLLLLHGQQPALVDSGFACHADETAAWVRAHAGRLALVVNTHWHSDHVGGKYSGPVIYWVSGDAGRPWLRSWRAAAHEGLAAHLGHDFCPRGLRRTGRVEIGERSDLAHGDVVRSLA